MNVDKIKQHCYKFIDKLNYKFVENQQPRVDHINKLVCLEGNDLEEIVCATLKILFWNTPKSCYNFFVKSYEHNYEESFNIRSLANTFIKVLASIEDINYDHKDKNLYFYFHPYINKELVLDLYKALIMLSCKMFNDEDNYFKKETNTRELKANRAKLDTNLTNCICVEYVGCITGSFALATYGTVYRNSFKDIDFAIPSNVLTKQINDILDENLLHNELIGKRRFELENDIQSMFKDTDLYKSLGVIYKDINIDKFYIDRVSSYDKFIKCSMLIRLDNRHYDFIFKDNISRLYKDSIGTYIQDIEDLIYSKTILGRPKDYKDLINFKPYKIIPHVSKKCVDLL